MKPHYPLAGALLLCSISLTAAAAERVISAGAGITELVVALGGESKLVAVDMSSQVSAPEQQIAKLGYHRALSAEGMLASEPDLLLGSEEMGPEAALNVVRDAGIEVAVLPSATTPEQLLSNVNQVAKLIDQQPQVAELTEQIHQQLARIEQLKAKLQRQPNVLFVLLRGDRAPRLGGDNTPADRIIKLAGAHNGAGFSGYKTTSEETLLSLKPDLILVTKPQADDPNEDPAAQLLEKLPLLKFTPAGSTNHVVNLPAAALLGGLGPSALNATEDLAQKLVALPKG